MAVARKAGKNGTGASGRSIQIQRVAGQVPSTPQAPAMNPAYQASMQNAAQINQNPMGFGLGQAMNYMTGGIVPGAWHERDALERHAGVRGRGFDLHGLRARQVRKAR